MLRRGTTSSPSSISAVCARPWVSTKPTTTSVPRSSATVSLAEHGVGLAHARCCAEVDPELPAGAGRAWSATSSVLLTGPVERQVEQEDVDARLAEEAERAPLRCAGRRAVRTSAALRPRSRATRATCCSAYSGLIWGSRPEPLASSASGATGRRRCRRLARAAAGVPRPPRRGRGCPDARLLAPVGERVVAVAGRGRTALEVRRVPSKDWPISVEPTTFPSADQGAVRLRAGTRPARCR